jgi:hypothetical protein
VKARYLDTTGFLIVMNFISAVTTRNSSVAYLAKSDEQPVLEATLRLQSHQ